MRILLWPFLKDRVINKFSNDTPNIFNAFMTDVMIHFVMCAGFLFALKTNGHLSYVSAAVAYFLSVAISLLLSLRFYPSFLQEKTVEAIRENDLNALKFYMEYRPRMVIPKHETVSYTEGMTLLHFVAGSRSSPRDFDSSVRIEMAKILLSHGADIDEADEHGDTALMWAARMNYIGMVSFLVESGANLNVFNRQTQLSLKDYARVRNDQALQAIFDQKELNQMAEAQESDMVTI